MEEQIYCRVCNDELGDSNWYDCKRYGRDRLCKKCSNAQSLAWRISNPEKRMLNGAKRRAMEQNVPCTITLADIVIPTHCPALNHIELKFNENGAALNSPSLDRIIPSLGYVPGNVAVISNKANMIKSSANSAEIGMVYAWLKSQEDRIGNDPRFNRTHGETKHDASSEDHQSYAEERLYHSA